MARSRPNDDASLTRTPKTKSSTSSILQAFKNLTTGKPKAAPSSPSTATSASPPPSSYSNFPQLQPHSVISAAHSSSNGTHSDRNGDFERLVLADGSFVGGPNSLHQQIQLLTSDRPMQLRAQAAHRIAKLLKDYPVNNVMNIWVAGRSLLEAEEGSDAVDAAYALLIACVRYKRLTPQERRYFFESIPRSSDPSTFSQRFKVLQEITSNGRYLECLEEALFPLLVNLLDQCFEQVLGARKHKGVKQSTSLSEEHNLTQVYEYTSDVIKFNSKMLQDDNIRALVNQLLTICRKTAAESDLRRSIEIMDGIMTYSYIPDSRDLYDYLQIVCVVFCAIRNLKELAWRSICNVLKSHHGPISTTALLMILKNSSHDNNLYRDATKGAVLIFYEILSAEESADLPPVDMRKLVSAVRKSLDANSSRLETCALRLVLFLLQDNDPTTLLLNEKLWRNFSEIIVISCRRLKPENRAQALTSMPSDILSIDFHTETEKGMDAAITSNQLIIAIFTKLLPLAADMDIEQKGMVMDLMMDISHTLDDRAVKYLLDFYGEERLQLPTSDNWRRHCDQIYAAILLDTFRSEDIRAIALQTLHDAHNIGEVLGASDAHGLITNVLTCIKHEKANSLVRQLAGIAADVAMWTADDATFTNIIDCLTTALFGWSHETMHSSSPLITAKDMPYLRAAGINGAVHDSHGTHIASALVRVFLRAIHTSAFKTETIYNELLKITASNDPAPDARVICLKALFRMRGDVNHGIFIVPRTDCESIAAALCRTAETMMGVHAPQESPIIKAIHAEDSIARRKPGSSATPLTRTVSGNVKLANNTGYVSRPTPPVWMYPGPRGLPAEPYEWASHLVFSHLDSTRSPDLSTAPRITLRIKDWLHLILGILQNDVEWEVFSYILVHLGAQLMNHSLFVECVPEIQLLRNIICGQLANKNFHEPPGWTNLNRSDVAVCMYHIMTVLVSYHDHFSTSEQEDMVKMFIHGIGAWERASEMCIHGLSVCCHELPVAVSRSLEPLLQKLSQIITQTHNVVHVLDFLSALGRLPELYSDFQQHEFHLVFEVLFRYLRSIRPSHHVAAVPMKSPGTPRIKSRDPSPAVRHPRQNMEEHLPQYVFALSYHVMTFWFISLSMSDRPKQIPWIIENLTYFDENGQPYMDEQAIATLDFMQRVSYSDRDETLHQDEFSSDYDGKCATQKWLIGLSILSIETAGRTGISQIAWRRASGTRYAIFKPSISRPPRHQVPIMIGTSADAYYTDEYVGILPAHVLQEYYAPLHLAPTMSFGELPIPLPDDEATNRSVSTFDRILPLDGHKIGVIYVGEAQYTEQEILSNVMGSADYIHFLRHIGTLTRLKDATFNTQGLDRVNDEDGAFTFCWRDRVSELVFHVTTMMPTNLHDDPICMNKKKHVGNDFVNIIFNNAGTDYEFDTISSAFNYVNIIITPEARASFVETRLWARDQIARHQLEASVSSLNSNMGHVETQRDMEASSYVTDVSENPYAKLNYKVKVVTAPGMPLISPAAETKIVSGAALPAFVRLIALNASVFCQVWANRESAGGSGEHVSSWRSRLKEIKKLREKHAQAVPVSRAPERVVSAGSTASTGSQIHNNTSASTQDAANSPRSAFEIKKDSGLLRRTSLANIWSLNSNSGAAVQNAGPATTAAVGDRTSWLSNQDVERSSSTSSFI